MLSLVNYGASDSENEITDEEEEVVTVSSKQNGENKEEDDSLAKSMSTILKIPEPARSTSQVIEEDDDEFLHKKEVPEVRPPPAPKPKQKVKIMIPKLSDFKDEDDDELSRKIPMVSNKKTGLLGMLPKPTNSIGPSPKPQVLTAPAPQKPSTSIPQIAPQTQQPAPSTSSSSSDVQTKKIGFIPYALMDHKKAADTKKVSKKKGNESDSDEEESTTSFFTFSSNDDLPPVSEEEIKSLIAKEANRLERKRQNENSQDVESEPQDDHPQYYQQPQQSDIDKEAISALVGGNRAKRSKFEDIQIVDLSASDVLPDREEFIRRTLAGDTQYIPTGQIDEKVSDFFSFLIITHSHVYIQFTREKFEYFFC